MDDLIYSLPNTPPCARYEGGENNARLTQVWTYVAGLVGGGRKADDLSKAIARLYDYKGSLIVATRSRPGRKLPTPHPNQPKLEPLGPT